MQVTYTGRKKTAKLLGLKFTELHGIKELVYKWFITRKDDTKNNTIFNSVQMFKHTHTKTNVTAL